jgi:predicted MPP superfamily phosphohydrolase
MKPRTVLILGDAHLPYGEESVLSQAISLVKQLKPYYVVQIGDLYDFYFHSRYPKKLLNTTPEEEYIAGREEASDMWKNVQKASPTSKCLQLLGNHDERPYKRLLESHPELMLFAGEGLKKMFTFKGVETIHDSTEELQLETVQGEVLFHHGHRSKLGDHMVFNQMSTVVGHSHQGGVVFKQYSDGPRFELNCGYSGDPSQGPLKYGSQQKKYWTHGCGVIDELGPRFVPLKGRK